MKSIRPQFTCTAFLVFLGVVNTIGMGIAAADQSPKIQMAIILDTSNSMDGLIDQTRNQLWQVVNEFSGAKQNGLTPALEISLFEYGNDNNPANNGYVRRLNTFTGEIDAVSEGLFSLTTRGGSEYSGFAIKTVVENLQWSQSDSDLKTIFIAGNENFNQGPVSYRESVLLARRHGITVNTIHAGSHEEGVSHGWQHAAMLAGGDYLSIDANQQVVHVIAPQDEEIARLNAQLNDTYLPYGAEAKQKVSRQQAQDQESEAISIGYLAKRATAKATELYRNANWDLVDALKEGKLDELSLLEMDEAVLPATVSALPEAQRIDHVRQKMQQREQIKTQIGELGRLRADYLAEKQDEQTASAPTVSDAFIATVRKQAKQKNFIFE